ncbi:MAG TPA: 30S ribosomal protein S11 [Coxiellaceae bacterium]|nr:30S ribosomal protein S11 [Coxiellaceae bacterium]
MANPTPTPEKASSSKTAAAVKRKKTRIRVRKGAVHIKASFNNTIVTITDDHGNVLAQSSAGAVGFKGSRKSTPHAGKLAAEEAAKKAKEWGLEEVEAYISGPGAARESAVRAIREQGIRVIRLIDTTCVPHNGCRPKKKRRV